MPEQKNEKDNNSNKQIKYENNNIYRKIILPVNTSLIDYDYRCVNS